MEDKLDSLLKQFFFMELEYCGSQGFYDGTRNAYYLGKTRDGEYEIDVRIIEELNTVEIWEKMRSENEEKYLLGKARKAERGWRILAN